MAVATTLPGGIVLRDARPDELPALVGLLAEDALGETREDPDDLAPYREALAAIDADPAHRVLVAVDGGALVATLQLSILPGLARHGARRAQIEAVRVRGDRRGDGIGAAMIGWAIAEARRRRCALLQLTSDRSRADALRFYARLGFVASHEGLKLTL